MEADFSGYATKAGLKCTDGRTIMPGAFADQDPLKVPLVWQHGHTDVKNVLGHAILENRDDGVYTYGFFNDTEQAQHAKKMLEHGDISMLSIWANSLVEKAGRVLHGAIREVSLVLSGANPGALIDNVTVRHSDGDDELLDDEAIIYTGLELEHGGLVDVDEDETGNETGDEISHAADGEVSIQDVYDSMSEEQQQVLHYMVGEALADATGDGTTVEHAAAASNGGGDGGSDMTIQDVYDSMNEQQKQVLHYMVGEALAAGQGDSGSSDTTTGGSAKQSAIEDGEDQADKADKAEKADDKTISHDNLGDSAKNDKEGTEKMTRNVFETDAVGHKGPEVSISHADMEGIVADATKNGSLKDAVSAYALSHGIDNIDVLFPDAKALATTPEFLQRRTEWVDKVLGGATKSPFARIKNVTADLTYEAARAKGYIKGSLKKEEFFPVARRVTTPTTIYKKQKLDRDDMIDITDFDVVAWLKAEMRVMLDEELARAILVGDGRDVDDDDKINEGNIRPIASDHELYTTTVRVNIDDANSSVGEVTDAIILNRQYYRGSGLPTLFTTETYISRFLLLKDTIGRRVYKTLDELVSELRVAEIVPVEVLEEYSDIVCILVNMRDYVLGADQGGQVSLFDDFDIDYNQYKYLIETRVSGALNKLKSAICVRKTAANLVAVTPNEPDFDGDSITITNQTGVVYQNAADDSTMNAAGSPYAVAEGQTVMVVAVPASGYYFPSSVGDSWTYTGEG